MRQSRWMTIKRLCLLAATTSLIYAAPASSGEADRIVYRVRTIGIVCAGICPHFELSVGRDGSVVERFLGITDERTVEGTRERRAFHVSRRRADVFFAALASLRPSGRRRFDKPCDAQYATNDSVVHGLSEYEIRWQGGGSPGYMEACFDDAPIRAAIERALRVIGIDPSTGKRATSRGRR